MFMPAMLDNVHAFVKVPVILFPQACRVAGKGGAHLTAQFEILPPSDFSARSHRPLDRTLQLASVSGGRVVIAHVLDKENRDTDAATLERLQDALWSCVRLRLAPKPGNVS